MYFDYAATTPMDQAVIEAMTEIMETVYGNPSSIHNYGRKASQILEQARSQIATQMKAKPSEIIFTSGGTESNNMAIFQAVQMQKGRHIITTPLEHPSVGLPIQKLKETHGFDVTTLAVDVNGQISLEELCASLREDTCLVSIMAVNNEVGVLFPIKEIGEILKNHPAVFHVDAVQAFPYFDMYPKEWHIDFMSFSAHKMSGPKGVGFLFRNANVPFTPLLLGGEQEELQRAGTENLAGIVGLAKAVEIYSSKEKKKLRTTVTAHRQLLLEKLRIDYQINGAVENLAPHILSLYFPKISNHLLLVRLDLKNIAVSIGSACSAGNVNDSHVLLSMFEKTPQRAKESIRISFGKQTTTAEIEELAENLNRIIQNFQ